MDGLSFTPEGMARALELVVMDVQSLHLFVNDPLREEFDGTFVEPSAKEYKPFDVQQGYWKLSDGDATGKEARWEFTRPFGKVYGWFAKNNAGAVALVERFSKPVDFEDFGGRVRVTPIINLRQA